MPATYTLVTVDGSTVVSIAGELDASNAEDMFAWVREALDAAGCECVCVDLDRVRFIDSTTVRYLIHAHAYAQSSGVALRVANARDLVHRVLWTTGVAGVLGMA
ncbi:STAS domain-containing protein [Catellatospora tritici]|uniref:STAS domain-containing protein n=1 Tax=Catellatospora tritici TaxID=2851566 RepID=UPI001C2DD745|nr:STAS domain-containing protein [Catellatospora tritici]MBV1856375.1 STAS domain-containing protein [Catellatospora tritici]